MALYDEQGATGTDHMLAWTPACKREGKGRTSSRESVRYACQLDLWVGEALTSPTLSLLLRANFLPLCGAEQEVRAEMSELLWWWIAMQNLSEKHTVCCVKDFYENCIEKSTIFFAASVCINTWKWLVPLQCPSLHSTEQPGSFIFSKNYKTSASVCKKRVSCICLLHSVQHILSISASPHTELCVPALGWTRLERDGGDVLLQGGQRWGEDTEEMKRSEEKKDVKMRKKAVEKRRWKG